MTMKTQDKIKFDSFTDHLIELRSRLIRSMVVFVLFFVLSYYFAEEIYNFLVKPYSDAVSNSDVDRRLIYTALHETFIAYLKVQYLIQSLLSPTSLLMC